MQYIIILDRTIKSMSDIDSPRLYIVELWINNIMVHAQMTGQALIDLIPTGYVSIEQ